MSDHYKHISEKAARKASDALSRAKAEQRAEARAKMREQAGVTAGMIQSDAILNVIEIGSGQSPAMVSVDATSYQTTESNIALILLVGAGRFERPPPCAQGTRVRSKGSIVYR